jgi:aminoglycoside phosphotransferase (APT) family kinase protein
VAASIGAKALGRKRYIATIMIVKLRPDLAISDAQAQAIVARVAPGRRLALLAPFTTGEIGAVFEMALDDGSKLVLKVYPEALHWKMQKEVLVARLLDGKLGVPTPRILLADDSKTLLDLNFVVMTRLVGESLIGLEPSLDRSDTEAVYHQMGRTLRELHDIGLEAFGYIGTDGVVTPFTTNRAYMLSQFERKLGGFDQLGGRPDLARQLRAYLERSTPLLDGCTRPAFCHYDFHTGNILASRVDGALRLTGIVDLENAIAGDPLMDLAKTIAYSVRDDETKRTGLLAGYGSIERADWQETLRLYQFYGAIELWAWWTEIGDRQRADHIVGELERYVEA